MKGTTLTIFVLAVLLIGGAAGSLFYLENHEAIYYTKIDNANMQKNSDGEDLPYEYTLESYDQNGRKKELTFKAGKELRQGAYLRLEVRALGVHRWEEVSYAELPQKVQEKLP